MDFLAFTEDEEFTKDEKKLHRLYKSLERKSGRCWSKFKGDRVTRTIIGLLSKYIPSDFSIANPNAFIEEFPVEFDILVVKKNSEPALQFSNVYRKEDVKLIIECKMQGFFYKENEAKSKIAEYFRRLEDSGLPFVYITLRETKKMMCSTLHALTYDKAFFLGVSRGPWIDGEWERFVTKVLDHLI